MKSMKDIGIDWKVWLWAGAFALIVGGCGNPDKHGHEHDGHGHAQDPGAPPTEEHTRWTDRTELFVEFPVLTVGVTSRFAAHFTLLDGHRPVEDGSVTVSLIKGGKGIRHTVDAPASPGIFTPALQPGEAGIHQLVFDLKTPLYSDRIVLDSIRVYPDMAAAEEARSAGEEPGQAITFLKEQAWKTEFQTAAVTEKDIGQLIPTFGTWKVAASDFQTVVAPFGGRVRFEGHGFSIGNPVKKGQTLMTISSSGMTTNNLETEIQNAKVVFEQAEAEYLRKKPLLESRIITRTAFEEVEKRYLLAKSSYETLHRGYGAGGKSVVAPFDGYITTLEVPNGGFVEQGATLFSVSRDRRSLLEVQVSPDQAAELQDIRDILYQPVPGHWSSLREKGGTILAVGKEVSPEQPMLAIVAEVREGVAMPKGSFTEAQILVGRPETSLVVPRSALMEDYGQFSVIVQLSGESFERREVIIGKQNGDEVGILRGVEPGEFVVSKGAYQVKMAAMSGQAPAHGHAH